MWLMAQLMQAKEPEGAPGGLCLAGRNTCLALGPLSAPELGFLRETQKARWTRRPLHVLCPSLQPATATIITTLTEHLPLTSHRSEISPDPPHTQQLCKMGPARNPHREEKAFPSVTPQEVSRKPSHRSPAPGPLTTTRPHLIHGAFPRRHSLVLFAFRRRGYDGSTRSSPRLCKEPEDKDRLDPQAFQRQSQGRCS